MMFKNMKKSVVGIGTSLTKQTAVKPNVNRNCPIEMTSHIQLQLTRLYRKSCWAPTSQSANGPPSYWGFQRYMYSKVIIAKWNLAICGSQHYEPVRHYRKSTLL